jgi:hypothetical protein
MLLWGTCQGLLLVGHRIGQQLLRQVPVTVPAPLPAVLSWGATFALISLGWVLFRANDLEQALRLLAAVVSPSAYSLSHVTLHADYFSLVGAVAGGYFAYVGLARLAAYWTAHYHSALLAHTASAATLGAIVLRTSHEIAIRKWWALTPVLVSMLVMAGLGLFGRGSTTAPFIYLRF